MNLKNAHKMQKCEKISLCGVTLPSSYYNANWSHAFYLYCSPLHRHTLSKVRRKTEESINCIKMTSPKKTSFNQTCWKSLIYESVQCNLFSIFYFNLYKKMRLLIQKPLIMTQLQCVCLCVCVCKFVIFWPYVKCSIFSTLSILSV